MYSYKKEKKEKLFNFIIEPSKDRELERLSKKLGMSKAQLVRNFIDAGVSDLRMMEKVGVLKVAVKTYDFVDDVKKSIFKNKYRRVADKIIVDIE